VFCHESDQRFLGESPGTLRIQRFYPIAVAMLSVRLVLGLFSKEIAAETGLFRKNRNKNL
jgi:hypothetical protein